MTQFDTPHDNEMLDEVSSAQPEKTDVLKVVERLKTTNQNDSDEVISTIRSENTELQFSVLEYIEQNPSEVSFRTALIKSIYDLLLESEENRLNDPSIFDDEGYENNENYEEDTLQENSNYTRASSLVTTLEPGQLGETKDHISTKNYHELKRLAVNNKRYAIEGFDDVVFTNGKVDEAFIDATLQGTPISREDLMNLKRIKSFKSETKFENFVLPTALLLTRVLKERGLPGQYFKVIFSLALSTMNTESGCGSNIIVNNPNSSALGLGQFLTSSAIGTFARMPERERQQYPELVAANKSQMKDRIRARLLGSATFNVRLTVSFIMQLFNKIKDKPGTNTSNVASRMYMAYNSGLANVDFILEFYEKFPLPEKGITQEAQAFLDANRHRLKGSALTRAAIAKSRLPKGRRAPWFHTQGRFNQIFKVGLGVETESSLS